MIWTVLSFCIVCASYLAVSRKDRSYVNFLTPAIIIFVPANYFLQWIYIFQNGAHASRFAYFYCYATYAAMFASAALAYCTLKPLRFGFNQSKIEIRKRPWILLAAAWALYLPVLLRFREYLLSPRLIYENTRTGYGLLFFGSSLLVNLAFILFLFRENRSKLSSLLFGSLCVALAFAHGSKADLIYFIMAYMLYRVYIVKSKIGFAKSVLCAAFLAAILMAAFFAFSRGLPVSSLLIHMAGYSDYSRNAMMLVDDPNAKRYYGQIVVENELYGRIPRFFWSDKPKDFGEFHLARAYYPDSFALDQGVPDFGIGMQYADFGVFAIIYICAWSSLAAFMAKTFSRTQANPSNFVMLLFFSGAPPLFFGNYYLLPEHLILACLVLWATRTRFVLVRLNGKSFRQSECTA